MLRLAAPLVLAELGWMLMGIVDTVMVGHLPAPAVPLSAVALAQILYNTVVFAVAGVLLGLDTVIAQAHGAGDLALAHRWFGQGLLLAAVLGMGLTGVLLLAPLGLWHLHAAPEVLTLAVPTLGALTWGTLPLVVTFALRRQLQAFNHARLIAAALVTANLVNLGCDWLLIFAHRGQVLGHVFAWPGYGVVGSGWATSIARVSLALSMAGAVWWTDRRHGYGLRAALGAALRPHGARLRQLLRLGLPVGGTILVEILIFALVTFLVAGFGPVPLAGNELALNLISFTFMVPLGISAAASVRVGQAVGRGKPREAKAAGWTAIGLSSLAMGVTSVLYLAVPDALASLFTPDRAVVLASVPLLRLAAIFQFCDGLQVTAIGALRGTGDTRSGLVVHLCSYWLLGLPLGLWLAFHHKLGAAGLWTGLTAALLVAGLTLVVRWGTRRIGAAVHTA